MQAQPSVTASAEAQEHLPLLSDTGTPSYSNSSPPQLAEIIYRRARLSDSRGMAYVATQAYLHSPLSDFLSPNRHEFYEDWIYSFEQRIILSILSPQDICCVAIDSATDQVVGAGRFTREGNDPAKMALVKKQWSLWNAILSRWYMIKFKIWGWVWPDRSQNKEHVEIFRTEHMEQRNFWDVWPARWYCCSFTVLPNYQRRGIGSTIMGEVQEMCRKEGVPLVLEASPEGEPMYLARGFKLLKRFGFSIEGENDRGGMMIYNPLDT